MTESGADDDGPLYDLVCGQGRVEAYQALDEAEIPGIVIEASEAECYLMSLVENLARRRHSNMDLLNAILSLKERGYSGAEIARKTNLANSYVNGIVLLLREGEERLINAVERGWLPITLAVTIARTDDSELQAALVEAYEKNQLRGDKLMRVRNLVQRRRTLGKRFGKVSAGAERLTNAQTLVLTYQNEARRQKLMIRKAEINEQRLLLLVTALKTLFADSNFVTLLRAEKLDTLPKQLAAEMKARTSA